MEFINKLRRLGFASLTGRIIILNIAGLVILASGILYLSQFQRGLIDARAESLLTQGKIIAGAIAASATIDTDTIVIDPNKLLELETGESISPLSEEEKFEFPINPEKVTPVLRQLISPDDNRVRIYDQEGELIIDSQSLYGHGEQILQFELEPEKETENIGFFQMWWRRISNWLFSSSWPLYKELGGANGKGYPEVAEALNGGSVSVVRVNEKHEIIISVAVPVQRFRVVLGAMLLSTKGGDIDDIVWAERWAIIKLLLLAMFAMVVISLLMASSIAGPMKRLANAADKIRLGVRNRIEIPDYSKRSDEIGHLSGALRDMTEALYKRLDAIERFAADVAHELKNPLTSLRSAVETLPLAKDHKSKDRLLDIIQHDVGRIDRLISDIADASRLDSELAKVDVESLNIAELIIAVVNLFNEVRKDNEPEIKYAIAGSSRTVPIPPNYKILGHDNRLGQVLRNLLDNAKSFSPKDSIIWVKSKIINNYIEIRVEDQGMGIMEDNLERIFDRFHTDRPDECDFGKNSGLGLSISKQIVEAHNGKVWAENLISITESGDKKVTGAVFIVRLPMLK